jgi:two-component sensor histidine kinase
MKYAFPGRDEGLISVTASRKDKGMTLIIEDNGIGIPESVKIEASTGFGLQLVAMLIKQLHGTVTLERQKGTRYILVIFQLHSPVPFSGSFPRCSTLC